LIKPQYWTESRTVAGIPETVPKEFAEIDVKPGVVAPNEIDFKYGLLANAPGPIVVSPLGKVIFVKDCESV